MATIPQSKVTVGNSLDEKHECLREILRDLGRVIVAFSASVPRADLRHSRLIAEALRVEHVEIETDVFGETDYSAFASTRQRNPH